MWKHSKAPENHENGKVLAGDDHELALWDADSS
jgi:hypothetical protein